MMRTLIGISLRRSPRTAIMMMMVCVKTFLSLSPARAVCLCSCVAVCMRVHDAEPEWPLPLAQISAVIRVYTDS